MANTDGLPSSDPAASEELDSILSGNDAPPDEEAADDNGQEGDQLTLEQEAEQLKEAAYDVRDRYQEVKNARQPKPETEPSVSPEAPSAPTEAPPPAPTPPASTPAGTDTPPPTPKPATSGAAAEATASTETVAASEAAAKSTAGRIAAGRAQVQALKQAAIAKGRQAAANMAVKKGITGAIGRVGTALLSEAMIPVIGWIMAAATLLWLAIKTKLGRAILLIIIILPLLPTIFFGLTFLAVGGVILPNSASEKQAATNTLALAGDFSASRETILGNIDQLKKTMQEMKALAAKKYDSAKAAVASGEIDTLIADVEAIIRIVDQKEERLKAIQSLNEKLKAFAAKFPEIIVYGGGKCADLKPFMDNKQFIVREGPNRELILKGQMMNNARQVWPASPDLCNALVAALQAGFTIETRNLSFTHSRSTASGNVSRHWCGAAIDIGRVNGEAATGRNQGVKDLAKFWFDASKAGHVYIGEMILPNNFNEFEMKNNRPSVYSYDIRARHHEDHIHLSGRIVDLRCRG